MVAWLEQKAKGWNQGLKYFFAYQSFAMVDVIEEKYHQIVRQKKKNFRHLLMTGNYTPKYLGK